MLPFRFSYKGFFVRSESALVAFTFYYECSKLGENGLSMEVGMFLQMGIVLEGKVGLTIGLETREIKKGDMFLIPPKHSSRAGLHLRPASQDLGYFQSATGRVITSTRGGGLKNP
jgi:hypothetical protein